MGLLGIDVGSSGCKAAVFSEDGRELSSAHEEYDYQHLQPSRAGTRYAAGVGTDQAHDSRRRSAHRARSDQGVVCFIAG